MKKPYRGPTLRSVPDPEDKELSEEFQEYLGSIEEALEKLDLKEEKKYETVKEFWEKEIVSKHIENRIEEQTSKKITGYIAKILEVYVRTLGVLEYDEEGLKVCYDVASQKRDSIKFKDKSLESELKREFKIAKETHKLASLVDDAIFYMDLSNIEL